MVSPDLRGASERSGHKSGSREESVLLVSGEEGPGRLKVMWGWEAAVGRPRPGGNEKLGGLR